jgi:hypothetical protein
MAEAKQDGVALIKKLEEIRGSRLLCLFLGDRPGLETRLAPDIIPLTARHLRGIGEQKRIDLFLYTIGGDIMAAFRLVALIREYCEEFNVLVPFRCQSAGTLTALGANEIVMLPESQLSPVDPTVNGPYNPTVPGVQAQPGGPLPVLPVALVHGLRLRSGSSYSPGLGVTPVGSCRASRDS